MLVHKVSLSNIDINKLKFGLYTLKIECILKLP